MQTSEGKKKREIFVRTVWRPNQKDGADVHFVPRCSRCGNYKRPLHVHWFFTGRYCVACIQDVLYDNCRTIEEINK